MNSSPFNYNKCNSQEPGTIDALDRAENHAFVSRKLVQEFNALQERCSLAVIA